MRQRFFAVSLIGIIFILLVCGCDFIYIPLDDHPELAMLRITTEVAVDRKLGFIGPAIARTPDGMIYVNRYYPDRLTKISPDGTYTDIPIPSPIFQLTHSANGKLYGSLAQGLLEIFKDDHTELIAGSSRPIMETPVSERKNIDGPPGQGRFERIASIATDDAGNLFVSVYPLPTGYIRKIDSRGSVSTIVKGVTISDDSNNFAYNNFAVDSHESFYFGTKKGIARLTKSGMVKHFPESDEDTLPIVTQIKVDGHDNVYVKAVPGAFFSGTMWKITQAGKISPAISGGCEALARGWAAAKAAGCTVGLVDGPIDKQIFNVGSFDVDDDGNIYFIDKKFSAIRKLTPDGALSTIVRGAPALDPLEYQALHHERLHFPMTLSHLRELKKLPNVLSILKSALCMYTLPLCT